MIVEGERPNPSSVNVPNTIFKRKSISLEIPSNQPRISINIRRPLIAEQQARSGRSRFQTAASKHRFGIRFTFRIALVYFQFGLLLQPITKPAGLL